MKNTPKKLFAVIIFVLFTPFLTETTNAEFSDVIPETKYKTAIEYLQQKGIVKGDETTQTFRPYDTINRAEFLKIVLLAGGKNPTHENPDSCFPDVPKNEWYTKYICYAQEQGFVKGKKDGKFHPEEEIEFVEAAKILVEVLKISVPKQEEGEWYEGYVKALTETKKVPRSILSFDYRVKRNDMAEMVWRVLEKNAESKGDFVGNIQKNIVNPEFFEMTDLEFSLNTDMNKNFMEGVTTEKYNIILLYSELEAQRLHKGFLLRDNTQKKVFYYSHPIWDFALSPDAKFLYIGKIFSYEPEKDVSNLNFSENTIKKFAWIYHDMTDRTSFSVLTKISLNDFSGIHLSYLAGEKLFFDTKGKLNASQYGSVENIEECYHPHFLAVTECKKQIPFLVVDSQDNTLLSSYLMPALEVFKMKKEEKFSLY